MNTVKNKLVQMYKVMPKWAKVTTCVVAAGVTGVSLYRLKKKNKTNETTDEKVEE